MSMIPKRPMDHYCHSVCLICCKNRFPERKPAAVEKCCLCGESTASGIYVRIDPTHRYYPWLLCKGVHDIPQAEEGSFLVEGSIPRDSAVVILGMPHSLKTDAEPHE